MKIIFFYKELKIDSTLKSYWTNVCSTQYLKENGDMGGDIALAYAEFVRLRALVQHQTNRWQLRRLPK